MSANKSSVEVRQYDHRPTRAELRAYYYEQRRRAREFSQQYDLTDEEIERKIDDTLGDVKGD